MSLLQNTRPLRRSTHMFMSLEPVRGGSPLGSIKSHVAPRSSERRTANRKAGFRENRLKQNGSLVGDGDTRFPRAIAGRSETRDRSSLMLMDPHRHAARMVGNG